MLNLFKSLGRGKDVSNLAIPAPMLPELIYQKPIMLKPTKWVTHTQTRRVGIIATLHVDGTALVHYVNDRGETIAEEKTLPSYLRLAFYEEIPAPRRPDTSVAFRLGYIPRPTNYSL